MEAQTQGTAPRWLYCLCAAAAGLLFAPAAPAATFENLFTVTVDVAPTADDPRADAIERGMAIVLSRVTGRPQATAYPELAALIESAPRLVTRYGNVDGDSVQVRFNGSAVESALTALQWPVWGAERPLLVLWAAIDFGDGKRAILADREDDLVPEATVLTVAQQGLRDAIAQDALRAANERGIPLVLPRMDQIDAQLINFAEIRDGFDASLIPASERYGADFALLARIALTDFGLDIDWELMAPDGRRQALLTSTVREGIDWIADRFAAQFSSSGGLRQMHIDIEGIASLAEYGRVLRYLETLSIVASVDVAAYSGQVLNLVASIRGDDAVLDRVFALGGVLEPAGRVPFGAVPGGARRYSLAAGASPRQ